MARTITILDSHQECAAALRHHACMQDARFNQLYAAWRTAEDALEAYIAATADDVDPAVRRVVIQQLRNVALKRYGSLCRHVSICRRKLRLL